MKSLAPKDYLLLPKLDAPAGYIIVLRDIDRDAYRFDRADHPASYVDRLLAELTGNYGIELISILETDDLATSESQLFDAHHARLCDEWIHLDNHQMATLRQSDLQINAHRSYYFSPRQFSPAEASNAASNQVKGGESRVAGQSQWEQPDAPPPPPLEYVRYHDLKNRPRATQEAHNWRQTLSDKFDDFFHNHPGCVIAIMLLLMLLILIHFWRNPCPLC